MFSGNKAAAVEELREASQHKVVAFAERAAGAERHARETAARLRALESGQASLQVCKVLLRTCAYVCGREKQTSEDALLSLRKEFRGL